MYHVVHPVHVELVGGGPPEVRPLIHLWSLTVEEHFYLLGVLVVIVAVRRNWTRALIGVFLAAWVFIGLARATGLQRWQETDKNLAAAGAAVVGDWVYAPNGNGITRFAVNPLRQPADAPGAAAPDASRQAGASSAAAKFSRPKAARTCVGWRMGLRRNMGRAFGMGNKKAGPQAGRRYG
jgi:hypothetical protein